MMKKDNKDKMYTYNKKVYIGDKKHHYKSNNSRYSYNAALVMIVMCVVLLFLILWIGFGVGSSDTADSVQTEAVGENVIIERTEQTEFTAAKDEMDVQDSSENISEETDKGSNIPVSAEVMVPEEAVQEPEVYEFTSSDPSYFDDALFIGDSRTVGLREYGTLGNADYFATPGLNLYTIGTVKAKIYEKPEGEQLPQPMPEPIEVTLEEMLSSRQYGKVYVMLGINELGYDFERTVVKYGEFLEYLQTTQPDAILYVCANLHVNSVRNELDEIHNNRGIDRINQEIAAFADQKDIFYLDVNPLFDDEEGNLAKKYISDDSHLMGIYYEQWCNWYCENTIVK